MPTPRWSILFQRIQCDSEAVSSVARPHRGSAGCPVLGNHPVAGRDRGPDRDDGAGDWDPARAAAPAGLFAWVSVLMPDSLFEFGEPLLHRPLDLRFWSARLVRPDARPVRPNRFRRWVGIRRFRFNRELRREFRHLPKSYPRSVPEPVGALSS